VGREKKRKGWSRWRNENNEERRERTSGELTERSEMEVQREGWRSTRGKS